MKLKCDDPLLNFGFKFKLRRYTGDSIVSQKIVKRMLERAGAQCTVRRCR